MKYSTSIEINLPREKVINAFDNQANNSKWMEGLESAEVLSGTPNQEGAKTRLNFNMGKRKIEMIETVKDRNLPDSITMTYQAQGVFNIVKNKFIAVDNHKTRYETENEFQFKGFMKLVGLLMPGSFKKQSIKYLNDFKNFVETAETDLHES